MARRLLVQCARTKMFLSSIVSLLLALAGLARGQSRGFCTTVDGQNGQCRPLVKCVRFFHEIPTLQQRPCPLTTGEKGVCCPHIVLGSATCELLILLFWCTTECARMNGSAQTFFLLSIALWKKRLSSAIHCGMLCNRRFRWLLCIQSVAL